jgi:hypothetical protein
MHSMDSGQQDEQQSHQAGQQSEQQQAQQPEQQDEEQQGQEQLQEQAQEQAQDQIQEQEQDQSQGQDMSRVPSYHSQEQGRRNGPIPVIEPPLNVVPRPTAPDDMEGNQALKAVRDPDVTYRENIGRRSYAMPPPPIGPTLSNLRCVDSVLQRAISQRTLDNWELFEASRQKNFVEARRGVRAPCGPRGQPKALRVQSMYVVLDLVLGIQRNELVHEDEQDVCEDLFLFLKRKLDPKKCWLDIWHGRHGLNGLNPCEEGDERRFYKVLSVNAPGGAKYSIVKLATNPYMSIVPGSPVENEEDKYNNVRLRLGLRVFEWHHGWDSIWYTIHKYLFSTDYPRILFQPQVHPPHMAIPIKLGTPYPEHWVKKVAKAVIIFEEYVDQVHAFYSTNRDTPTTKQQLTAPRGTTLKNSAPMHRYWHENRDMSNRWNQVFREKSRLGCLHHIDSLESVWEVVQAMNPRPDRNQQGVFPDYKWDFTGLISMGGYEKEMPRIHDIHDMLVVRQCFFTFRPHDVMWMQRLHKFVNTAIMCLDEQFEIWADPGKVTTSILRMFGMDVYEPEFKLLAAYNTAPVDGWPDYTPAVVPPPGFSPAPSSFDANASQSSTASQSDAGESRNSGGPQLPDSEEEPPANPDNQTTPAPPLDPDLRDMLNEIGRALGNEANPAIPPADQPEGDKVKQPGGTLMPRNLGNRIMRRYRRFRDITRYRLANVIKKAPPKFI